MIINICKDFSDTPGARYISEGKYSGEEFRESILIPAYEKVVNSNEKIIIEMDGGYGYPTSFLEEAFGGLARKFSPESVTKKLDFISEDEPALVDEVKGYILDANIRRKVGNEN